MSADRLLSIPIALKFELFKALFAEDSNSAKEILLEAALDTALYTYTN
jgi:hypothetical protein